MLTHTRVLGVKIHKVTLKEAVLEIERLLQDNKKHFIVTPNPEICVEAERNSGYREILDKASLSVPDGTGLILASFVFKDPIWHRVTGVDLVLELIKLANAKGYSVYLLGGEEGVAKSAVERLKEKYPTLRIVGAQSGGKLDSECVLQNEKEVIEEINKTTPDILFVAFGAPKQEFWIAKNLDKLNVKVAIGVGGTMDYLSEKKKRAPKFLRTLGLEWLFRLILEPKRFKRIFTATICFIFLMIKWRLRMIFCYRKNVVGFIYKNDNVLLVNRVDDPSHWQFPQGGIEKNEDKSKAILRELKEELGTDRFKTVKHVDNLHKYKWGTNCFPNATLNYGYKGQKQSIMYLEYFGTDKDIILDKKEHADFKWVKKKELISATHPIRTRLAELALKNL